MTIFDYTNLPIITVPYILRDSSNTSVGVWVTNQETKEKVFLDAEDTAVFYTGFFTIDITGLLSGVNEDTTFLVSAIDSNGDPIYRDIVVFEQRLDAVSDYEQNDETGEYIFA